MEISAISNADIVKQGMNIRIEEGQTESFQQMLENASKQDNPEQLKSACKAFESYYLHMMLKSMRATVPDSGLVPKSQAEQIFQDMLDEETAKNASDAGGIGLADMLYKQLSRQGYKM